MTIQREARSREMPEMTNLLTFEGYWRAPHIAGLPAASGVYDVYAGAYTTYTNTVNLRRLLSLALYRRGRQRPRPHRQARALDRLGGLSPRGRGPVFRPPLVPARRRVP